MTGAGSASTVVPATANAVFGTLTGSQVTVTWELHPATFWRRVLLARIRARQLARSEIPASLAALARAALAVQPADG